MFFQQILILVGTPSCLSGHLRAHKTDWPTVVTDIFGSGLTVTELFPNNLRPLDSVKVSAVSSHNPRDVDLCWLGEGGGQVREDVDLCWLGRVGMRRC